MNRKVISDNTPAVIEHNNITSHQLAYCSSFEARQLLSYQNALKYMVLPMSLLEEDGERLFVAVCAKSTAELLGELRFITSSQVLIEEAQSEILEQAICLAYQGEGAALSQSSTRANLAIAPQSEIKESAVQLEAIPELLEKILFRANYLQASDIHLESFTKGYQLRLRVDGLLRNETSFMVNRQVAANLIRRIKILSKLDITLTEQPQEGSFYFNLGKSRLNCRVSIIPAINGEKVVLRILERNEFAEQKDITRTLLDLGLNIEQAKIFISMLNQNSGAILLAGPTGSGKTTLLYSALEYLNKEWRNIITLEDPVERRIDGINQIQIERKNNQSFSELLSKIVRQDPDVVMLGEIRDIETAQTAMNAAITGHLVLSTVHAGDSFQVITRLKHFQLKSELLSSALKLIIAQRLLPLNCPKCIVEEQVSQAVASFFRFSREQILKFSTGCNYCQQSGIRGRIGVFEFLPISLKIQEIFLSYKNNLELVAKTREHLNNEGFIPIAFGVRELLKFGKISPITAFRTLGVSSEIL